MLGPKWILPLITAKNSLIIFTSWSFFFSTQKITSNFTFNYPRNYQELYAALIEVYKVFMFFTKLQLFPEALIDMVY